MVRSAARRVSNHEATLRASPFETPAFGGLLRVRVESPSERQCRNHAHLLRGVDLLHAERDDLLAFVDA